MKRLHRSDNFQLSETLDVFHSQVLRVLDTKPAIFRAVVARGFFKSRKYEIVRFIADSVNVYLQTGFVGGGNVFGHFRNFI
jgi:hypothetical protein